MSLLKNLIINLYRELLGPLTGDPQEVITVESPKSRFVTGILEPCDGHLRREQMNDYPDIATGSEADEDMYEDRDYIFHSPVNPVLNPDRLPVSIGLNFKIRFMGENPELKICATWGRYRKGESNTWKRESHFGFWKVQLNKGLTKKSEILTVDSAQIHSGDTGVQLHFSVYSEKEDTYNVRVSLVNYTSKNKDNKWSHSEENLVFQPCIRVKLTECTSVPVEHDATDDLYELQFIPERQIPQARGMLCAVVWKDIDPAIQDRELLDCIWPDGRILQKEHPDVYREFIECDFRTEFLPVVSGPLADFEINGLNPDPDELSELQPGEARTYFSKLLEGYRKWIEKYRTAGSKYREYEKFLKLHEKTLEMIEKGVNLLNNEREILLCFNFANKVISTVQKKWASRKDFRWRPFQIAFLLMLIEPLTNPSSPDRNNLYLLWIPTGGGKTEAYLAITAFSLVWRRRSRRRENDWYGPCVISRYTLRLLTLQQFQRMLAAITACEYLRNVRNPLGGRGWLPEWCVRENYVREKFVWGDYGFYAGLWVGEGITPNSLYRKYRDSEGFLERSEKEKRVIWTQHPPVSRCPACGSVLVIPGEGYPLRRREPLVLYFAVNISGNRNSGNRITITGEKSYASSGKIKYEAEYIKELLKTSSLFAVSVWKVTLISDTDMKLTRSDVADLIENIKTDIIGDNLCGTWNILSIAPYAPGYFYYGKYTGPRGGEKICGYTILCLNPDCDLNKTDREEYVPSQNGYVDIYSLKEYKDFEWMKNSVHIPALFVDEMVYSRLPSVIIATVDKFARLPFEPATAALFGNVNRYHPALGFYRSGALFSSVVDREPGSGYTRVGPFPPPSLILQDEIHLIEGPLGSLIALYETAVEALCCEGGEKPLYIASSATIRASETLSQALYTRNVFQFPLLLPGTGDGYFVRFNGCSVAELLKESSPGRIYMGLMAPGKGPLTPQVRVYSVLWKELNRNLSHDSQVSPVVGYYNAIRELAGGRRILEQDVPEFLRGEHMLDRYPLPENILELSSRVSAEFLGMLLTGIERGELNPHFIITTSIFGTGIDIPHLRYMVVNGQPKTTSAYIQATGRVGRREPAVIVTFYRASRPRDLAHYEFFMHYHMMLYRYVEWCSVFPFSHGCVRKAAGPVIVALMRNSRKCGERWVEKKSAANFKDIMSNREIKRDFDMACNILISRNSKQPQVLRMNESTLRGYLVENRYSARNRWIMLAKDPELSFFDYTDPRKPVVLGDLRHEFRNPSGVVFRKVPHSLRNIEGHVPLEIDAGGRTQCKASIRRSQFIRVYGPGAIYEAQNTSSVILRLENLRDVSVIQDPVLTGYMRSLMKDFSKELQNLHPVVYEIPVQEEINVSSGISVRAKVFQEWYLCSRHGYLWKASGRESYCPDCGSKKESFRNSSPVRFIQICESGHMDDIQWDRLLHIHGKEGRVDCSSTVLKWESKGSGLGEVRIVCHKCGRFLTLRDLFSLCWNDRIKCTGRYPEEPEEGTVVKYNRQECDSPARIVLRMASNVRVAETLSLLLVWPRADELGRILISNPEFRGMIKTLLDMYRNNELTLEELKEVYMRNLKNYQKKFTEIEFQLLEENNPGKNENILKSMEKRLDEIEHLESRENLTHMDLMSAEYRNLVAGIEKGLEEYLEPGRKYLEIDPDRKVKTKDFVIAGIDFLTMLEVQIGYRRYSIESGKLVPVGTVFSNTGTGQIYFPGMLISGEGIFFKMHASALNRDGEHFKRWLEIWKSGKGYEGKRYLFRMGARGKAWELHPFFVFLHTLSHLFIRAISIYAGYPSASLRERIYIIFPETDGEISEPSEGGFVIYTASEDEGGSMGGLVSLVSSERMQKIFEHIIRLALNCSNDPVCAEHVFEAGKHGGAACYACVLLSETSCEYRNLWLDRNILIENIKLLEDPFIVK